MRAALLSGYHRALELVDRPEPEPVSPRDVVVRVGAAGVCATDLHAIEGLMEPAGVRLPVPGTTAAVIGADEVVGEEVNDVLDRLRAGDVTGRAVLVP